MLISELPDDCLLTIFDYLNNLDDLVNCYKVCIKWSHLIAKRTKKAKYLIEFVKGYTANHNCVYFDYLPTTFDGTCLSTLFQNLIIIEIFKSDSFYRNVNDEDIVALVKNQKSLKGLTGEYYEFLSEYCDNLEMINRDFFEASIQHNGSSIKQLYHTAHFQKDAHYVPNLERLNFEYSPQCYDGPVLEKLKIVELWTTGESWGRKIDYSSKFMDFCPNLQSAHLRVGSCRLFVDETIKNECLQDLVLDAICVGLRNLNDLIRLLMKYPNLKHLSLRRTSSLKDEHIEQIVHILPNLVLFHVNECISVTQRAADYVQNHCKRHGRSIKFYFYENRHEIESDWPQLSTKKEKICRGFDFMKHCFLKNFNKLPYFLIPIDY